MSTWALLLVIPLLVVGAPIELKVMTFNLFYGGTSLNLTDGGWCYPKPHGCPGNLVQVCAAIREAGADIVGLEETEGNVATIAKMLGWYYSPRVHLVSRYPLLDPPDGDNERYSIVVVAENRMVLMTVAHAPSTPYGPYWVRDGRTLQDVLDMENSFRVPPVEPIVAAISAASDRWQAPAFIAGDFNTPSQLDWTPEAVAKRRLRYSVEWPMGLMLAQYGFVDSYRSVHSNPVADPGFTWTPWGPEDEPPGLEVLDRVDWVLSKRANATSSTVVGGPHMPLQPWPSDHYAVVSTFSVEPAPIPVMVSLERRRVLQGNSIRVFASGCCDVVLDGALIKVMASQNDEWHDLNSTSLSEGRHQVYLRNSRGASVSSAPFWVVTSSSKTTLKMNSSVVSPGDALIVHLNDAPGMMLDYLAVYPCGATVDDAFVYQYTGAIVEGTIVIQPPFYLEYNDPIWPLPSGCYQITLLQDDDPTNPQGNTLKFRVVSPPSWVLFILSGVIIVVAIFNVALFVIASRNNNR